MTISEQIYGELARIGHALADPTRLKMMNLLAQAERSVDDLSRMIGHSAPNTSAHLKVLQAANLVERRREGRRVYYSVTDPKALSLWLALRDMGLRASPELREVMRSIPDYEEVVHAWNAESLQEKMASGEVTLLDLRPMEEYDAGHLPWAVSVPASELEARLSEFDPQTAIIAYCRGPFCLAAIEGVAELKKRGFQARRLAGGVMEWLAEGQRLESTTEDWEAAEA